MMDNAKIFFEGFLNGQADNFWALPDSGSARKNYIGKKGNKKWIITYNENLQENDAFFYFSEKFAEQNLNTPKILSISDNRKIYIQEFLGEKTLSEIILEEGHSERVTDLVKKSLQNLFTLQQKTKGKIDFSKSFEYEKYDELPIMHDLYYFKNFLVDVLEIPYHKSSLLKEFKNLCSVIENLSPKTLMIRDFQSRNILINPEDKVFFIDYQSAMQGPAMYDVISFLYQAKANFPDKLREEMLSFYINLWEEKHRENLQKAIPYCQLIRFLQVLGAYGFRGIIQRKPHFLASLKQGIENIQNFYSQWDKKHEFPDDFSHQLHR